MQLILNGCKVGKAAFMGGLSSTVVKFFFCLEYRLIPFLEGLCFQALLIIFPSVKGALAIFTYVEDFDYQHCFAYYQDSKTTQNLLNRGLVIKMCP